MTSSQLLSNHVPKREIQNVDLQLLKFFFGVKKINSTFSTSKSRRKDNLKPVSECVPCLQADERRPGSSAGGPGDGFVGERMAA